MASASATVTVPMCLGKNVFCLLPRRPGIAGKAAKSLPHLVNRGSAMCFHLEHTRPYKPLTSYAIQPMHPQGSSE